jgi:hypothetical protein
MARVTYGALITELAGSIGGVTFHKNASGNIARLKPNMPMIASQAQGIQQNKLSQLIATWPTLTLVQKASWNALAAAHDHVNEFGETKTLNGFQWFMSCNLNLLQVGEAVILTAPVWTVMATPVNGTIAKNANNLYIRWDPNCNFTPNYAVLYISTPLRQSSVNYRRSMFFANSTKNLSIDYWQLTNYWLNVTGISWPTFYASAHARYILRVKTIQTGTGLASPYLTLIDKIG